MVVLAPGPGLTNGRRLVRGLAVLVFALGLGQSGARIVGTRFEPVFLVPAVLAVFLGWLLARLPLPARVVAQVIGFVASGLTVAYVADGTAADFGNGLLNGPRQVVTTAWPSPRFSTIFVAVAAFIYVAAAVSTDLAMRLRWRALAIAPMVVAVVAMIAVGAPDGPQWEVVIAATASAFALLWIGLDDRVASIRSGSLVAVTAALAALLASLGVSVAVAERANPRHGESANSELALLDPLAEVSAQARANPPSDLYRVESSSLSQLRRWRSAALDIYNGEAWSASGQLTPIGNRLDGGSAAPDISVTVRALRADTSLWISPGLLLRSSAPVETDPARRVVRIIGTERPAITTFVVEAAPDFSAAAAASSGLGTIQPTDIESSYSQLAATLAGSGTIAEKIEQLAATLHDDYQLNSGVSGGVQENLVDGFLRNSKVGNAEQFVTGFVLLARSLGVNARVATGYELDTSSTNATITTRNAVAWPEVRVGDGWAAVDMLPEDSREDQGSTNQGGSPQTPAAAQQLDPPQVNDVDSNDPVEAPPVVRRDATWSVVQVWLLRGGIFTGLLLWPFAVYAMVVSWKKWRRRRGLKSADPARRVSTAWILATDALIDAGVTLVPSQTNAELVAAGAETQPAAAPPLGRLQRHADAVTFTSATCDPGRGSDAVEQLRMIESSIRNSSSGWWKWKWWLSMRSLRRRTQSPLR